MSGIYIHIPFCHRRCPYCNFFSTASKKELQGFSHHIIQELGLRKIFLEGEMVNTIYFGGGTPSMLPPRELASILDEADRLFRVDDEVEVTLEANPEDIKTVTCKQWIAAGVNRLSIGVQSFRDEDLIYLGRIHDAGSALNSVRTALGAGFERLSLDLIYGIPGQSEADWQMNLNTLLSLRPGHLSAYSLTVEKGTPLERMIDQNKRSDVDDNLAFRHFMMLAEMAVNCGYDHYEISNFALPGEYSCHNTAYWKGKKYLGIGPSAHSYDGLERSWNPSSIRDYLEGLKRRNIPMEKETLSPDDRYNEYIMLGLRTMWGCDLGVISERFGEASARHTREILGRLSEREWIELSGDKLKLTREGLFHADGIASEFFL